MKVTVLSVHSEAGIVRIDLLGAELDVNWRGRAVPSIGEQDAELDGDPIDWSDVRVVCPGRPLEASGAARVRTEVIDVDPAGVVRLRALGGELLLDSFGDPPAGIIGSTIEFVPRGVQLYPTDSAELVTATSRRQGAFSGSVRACSSRSVGSPTKKTR